MSGLTAGPALQTGASEETRIEAVSTRLSQIRDMAEESKSRVFALLMRLDGERPTAATEEKNVDTPGQIGAIDDKISGIVQILDETRQALNDLERLL